MADLIQFDIGSGDRIARVVRTVEEQYRRAKPLTFSPILTERKRSAGVRMATYTGAWDIQTEKVVVFVRDEKTARVQNLMYPIVESSGYCAVFNEASTWYLAAVQHEGTAVLSDVMLGTALTFSRKVVFTLPPGDDTPVSIPITTCATATYS